MNDFNLKNFLVENKLTSNSKKISLLIEQKGMKIDDLENQYRQVLDKIDFKKVVDRYAPPEIEALPGVDDYIDAWKDSGGLDPEFLDPDKMLKDLINYASNLQV